jgi:capsid protein
MSDKSSAHWLERAEELRAEARRMKDTLIRLEMEIMARAYERLAARVTERHASPARLPVTRLWTARQPSPRNVGNEFDVGLRGRASVQSGSVLDALATVNSLHVHREYEHEDKH